MKKNIAMEKKWKLASTHEPLQARNGKRILFANVPADGHFNPLTGIALHLKEMGYDVRWYSTSIFAEKIKKLGIHYYPFKKAKDINGDNIDERLPQRLKFKSSLKKLNYDLEHFFIRRSVEYYEDLCEIHEQFPFDLVIADAMFMAIPFIKDKLGVPVMGIGITPLVEASKDLPPVGLGMTPANNLFGKWHHALLRNLAARIIFRKPNRLLKQMLLEYGINDGGEDLIDILVKKCNLFLQIGSPSFEYERSDLGQNIRYIGALAPKIQSWKKAPWYHPKLSQYNKVILVTQGTLEKNTAKILVPTQEAIKETE
jgi:UDP:flavonoid glycosyltransferase YjiC (YdhE family)